MPCKKVTQSTLLTIFEWSSVVHQIPFVIYENTCHFSFKFWIDLQYNNAWFLCTFLLETLNTLIKKSPLKYLFLKLSSIGSKLVKILKSILNAYASFSLNFASFFSVMTHNSSVLVWLKHNAISTKTGHKIGNFQTFLCSH